MSARPWPPADAGWPRPLQLRAMRTADLDRVMDVEQAAYPFPWTRDNFRSSLGSGYLAECLFDPDHGDRLVGYYVAQPGVDEMHLLNLTVNPDDQGQGWGRRLLDVLTTRCLQHDAAKLWLEVRVSNERARLLYERYGFLRVGVRRGYYPAERGREDGIVMVLDLTTEDL